MSDATSIGIHSEDSKVTIQRSIVAPHGSHDRAYNRISIKFGTHEITLWTRDESSAITVEMLPDVDVD